MSLPTTWMQRSVLWLEQHLAQYSGTVIATHDRFPRQCCRMDFRVDRGEGIPGIILLG
jgi:ATPase subunit of ABC transporter with duplicated ATPase domains